MDHIIDEAVELGIDREDAAGLLDGITDEAKARRVIDLYASKTTETADTEDQGEHGDEDPAKSALHKDLAKARRQRTEARTEAEQARAALAVARRQLVDQTITRLQYRPEGIRAGGLDEDSLFTTDGTLDTVAITHTVREIAQRMGLPREGLTINRIKDPEGPGATWADALNT